MSLLGKIRSAFYTFIIIIICYLHLSGYVYILRASARVHWERRKIVNVGVRLKRVRRQCFEREDP